MGLALGDVELIAYSSTKALEKQMKSAKFAFYSFMAIGLAACAEPRWDQAKEDGTLAVVPESVLSLAASYQDVSAVKLDPDTNCFWYLHRGPVEDTFLPLRTANGNPICAPKPDAEAAD